MGLTTTTRSRAAAPKIAADAAAVKEEPAAAALEPVPLPPPPPPVQNKVQTVLVIGAGMAGLAAARELQARGYDVCVLEARGRVGGRLKGSALQLQTTTRKPPHHNTSNNHNTNNTTVSIDLGGALIHGIDDNPVYQMVAQQMGVPTVRVEDCLLLTASGWPVDPKQDEKVAQSFNDCLEATFGRIQEASAAKAAAGEAVDSAAASASNHNRNNRTTAATAAAANATTTTTTTTTTSTTVPVIPGTTSFGSVFQQVCRERSVSTTDPLFHWHKANLEVSCGAALEQLGWQWNEDEPYGFDGQHVALRTSWSAVTRALAEPLAIHYQCPVRRIQIVKPPAVVGAKQEGEEAIDDDNDDDDDENHNNDNNSNTEDEDEEETPAPPVSKKPKVVVVWGKKRNPKQSKLQLESLPVRSSRRLRGETADTVTARRSLRANKGAGVDHYTIASHHDGASGRRKRRRRRRHNEDDTAAELPRDKTVVQVTLASGETLQADAVVCTAPLGILKQSLGDDTADNGNGSAINSNDDGIIFDPPLPAGHQQAIRHLGTGLLNKCALSFAVQFWQDSDFLGLALSETRSYLVLNAAKVTGRPVLLFMYGGAFAREIEDWTDAEIVADCMAVLRRICGSTVVRPPIDYQVTRWGREQYSRMSFTYVPPGQDGVAALQAMGRPVYDHTGRVPVLMFAGEHTTPYHPSTIHGAFLSGIREAYRLDCLMDPVANDYLEFSEESVYQKTFHVKRKFRGGGGTNGGAAAAAASSLKPTASPSRASASSATRTTTTTTHHQHRRRGAAGVMKLRRRPKTVLKLPPTPSQQQQTASLKAASTAVVGSNGHLHSQQSGGVARRSQRSAAAAAATHLSPDSGGVTAASSSATDPLWSAAAEPVDVGALEDRTLLRSLESYGPDYEYLAASTLPVHGDDTTPKTAAQVQQRLVRLLQKQQRQRKRSTAFKAWLAPKVAPPTVVPESTTAASRKKGAATPKPKARRKR